MVLETSCSLRKKKEKRIDLKQDDHNGNWEEIRNVDEIFEVILEQNTKMLIRSREGLTAT